MNIIKKMVEVAVVGGVLVLLPLRLEAAEAASALGSKMNLHISSSSDVGIAGTYVVGATGVGFEAIIGPPTPVEAMKIDPFAPIYEIDARFFDAGGTFLARVGGGEFLASDWINEVNQANDAGGVTADRSRSFQLARDAAEALKRSQNQSFSVTQMLLIEALGELAYSAENSDATTGEQSVAPGRPTNATTYYRHSVEIRRKGAFGLPLVDHSAVTVRSYNQNTGGLIFMMSTCNHGTCANSSTMTTKCLNYWSNRINAIPSFSENACENESDYGFSGCNRHVCNDDTLKQYSTVKYNNNSPNATCRDCTLRTTAPTCF